MTTPAERLAAHSYAAAALLSPGEVATIYGVTPKTVSRWADSGYLPCVRTPGGHRRFRYRDVARAMAEGQV